MAKRMTQKLTGRALFRAVQQKPAGSWADPPFAPWLFIAGRVHSKLQLTVCGHFKCECPLLTGHLRGALFCVVRYLRNPAELVKPEVVKFLPWHIVGQRWDVGPSVRLHNNLELPSCRDIDLSCPLIIF